MTLLLPLLMLGVAAADQPQSVAGDQRAVVAVIRNGSLPEFVTPKPFTMPESANPFASEARSQKTSTDAQDEARKQTCYTMRSYFFEREDDQGMTFVGMTRCDPGRAVTQKHVRGRVRLVPAN
jgi:hypothetical protein